MIISLTLRFLMKKKKKSYTTKQYLQCIDTKKNSIHVISAYPIDNWEKLKPVGFFKLAHNLVKGKKLPTPQK